MFLGLFPYATHGAPRKAGSSRRQHTERREQTGAAGTRVHPALREDAVSVHLAPFVRQRRGGHPRKQRQNIRGSSGVPALPACATVTSAVLMASLSEGSSRIVEPIRLPRAWICRCPLRVLSTLNKRSTLSALKLVLHPTVADEGTGSTKREGAVSEEQAVRSAAQRARDG
jgi:hypothetical protein